MKCTKAAAPAGGTWSTDYTYTFSVNSQSVDANKADKSFPPVTISFVSASGVTRIVQVESLTLHPGSVRLYRIPTLTMIMSTGILTREAVLGM